MRMRYIAAGPVSTLVYPSCVMYFTCSLAGMVLNAIVWTTKEVLLASAGKPSN
jgi:hypothetical protein